MTPPCKRERGLLSRANGQRAECVPGSEVAQLGAGSLPLEVTGSVSRAIVSPGARLLPRAVSLGLPLQSRGEAGAPRPRGESGQSHHNDDLLSIQDTRPGAGAAKRTKAGRGHRHRLGRRAGTTPQHGQGRGTRPQVCEGRAARVAGHAEPGAVKSFQVGVSGARTTSGPFKSRCGSADPAPGHRLSWAPADVTCPRAARADWLRVTSGAFSPG